MCSQPERGSYLPVLFNINNCLMIKGRMMNDINMITLLQFIITLHVLVGLFFICFLRA